MIALTDDAIKVANASAAEIDISNGKQQTIHISGAKDQRIVISGKAAQRICVSNVLPQEVCIQSNMHVVIGGEIYNGIYDITPKVTAQTVPTRDKIMLDDVTVQAIPYYETGNVQGGNTVYIGSDIKY